MALRNGKEGAGRGGGGGGRGGIRNFAGEGGLSGVMILTIGAFSKAKSSFL